MGLKLLHSADWHLCSPLTLFTGEQRELLARELAAIPERLTEVCRREGCRLLLLSGDLFDGPATADALGLLKEALAECPARVFIAPGNHDFCGPGSPWLEEAWPENVHIFTGGMESVAIEELDCRVWGAGYRSMDCPPLLEGFRARGGERWQVGILHGDPLSASSPYCPVTREQVRLSGLDYLALGHIHLAGQFRAGRTLCAWPGCPQGRGWDEPGEKGYYIVQLDDDITLRRESFPGIRFRDETVDVTQGAAQPLERLLPPGHSRDFFRLTLTGNADPDISALRHRFSRIPNLWLRDRTRPPVDLWAGAGADSLEGVFFRMLQEAADEAEEPEKSRILLAARLSRALLEGREVTPDDYL